MFIQFRNENIITYQWHIDDHYLNIADRCIWHNFGEKRRRFLFIIQDVSRPTQNPTAPTNKKNYNYQNYILDGRKKREYWMERQCGGSFFRTHFSTFIWAYTMKTRYWSFIVLEKEKKEFGKFTIFFVFFIFVKEDDVKLCGLYFYSARKWWMHSRYSIWNIFKLIFDRSFAAHSVQVRLYDFYKNVIFIRKSRTIIELIPPNFSYVFD